MKINSLILEVDFWTSPYTNGTVDFMISPIEYQKVIGYLRHQRISYKVNLLRSCMYSRVHISSDTAFLKILKKPSIVQE